MSANVPAIHAVPLF